MAANAEAPARDTIYALSSGRPPAAIAVMRLSGPDADVAAGALIGALPRARHASLRTIRAADGEPLDRALVLRFPGPDSATGEDIVELHLHGGAAIVAAVASALAGLGLREAEPGEFTRRALLAGRLDPTEVAGLADLLAAETETQRRDAMRRFDGALGRLARTWQAHLIALQAQVERLIDHDEEDEDGAPVRAAIRGRRDELATLLAGPSVERLRDGIRVVFAGPPNAGKSSLFNALLGSEAAIVSPRAGTTRDLIERRIVIADLPFVLLDTAGLRDADDDIEAQGVSRAAEAIRAADIVLDLDDAAGGSPGRIAVTTKCDLRAAAPGAIGTSAMTGEGIADLIAAIVAMGRRTALGDDAVSLDARHRRGLAGAREALDLALLETDFVLVAEQVRRAGLAVHGLVGHDATEAMLDALFSRFCLGK